METSAKSRLTLIDRILPSLAGIERRSLAWLFLMSLMLFLLLLPFSSYVAALPFIQDEWGLNNTQAGVVFSAYLAGYAFSALLLIPLTDRLGSKHILIFAAVLSVGSHIVFPLVAEDMVSGVLLRLVSGVGLVGIYTVGMRVVAERFSAKGRGMAVGAFVTAFYAANAVSLATTGALIAYLEWRDAYLVMALTSMLGVPLAFVLLRHHLHTASKGSSGRLDIGVLRDRAVRLYIMGYSLHAAELYVARVWLPVFLTAVLIRNGAGELDAAVKAATVAGLAMALGSIGPMIGGIISDRWGRPRTASVIFALSGLCSFAIGWMAGFPWVAIVALTIFYSWVIAADSAIYSTAVTEVADRSKLGSTMAIHSFIGFMGGVVGPIVVGGVLDLLPESVRWGIGFSFVGLLALVAVAGLMRVRDPAPGTVHVASSGSGSMKIT